MRKFSNKPRLCSSWDATFIRVKGSVIDIYIYAKNVQVYGIWIYTDKLETDLDVLF